MAAPDDLGNGTPEDLLRLARKSARALFDNPDAPVVYEPHGPAECREATREQVDRLSAALQRVPETIYAIRRGEVPPPGLWADVVQLRLGLRRDAPMSQQAIAERLGISGGKVAAIMQRALALLRVAELTAIGDGGLAAR